MKLDGSQGRSGRVWKISPTPALDPREVQPVASGYTVYAIPARHFDNHLHEKQLIHHLKHELINMRIKKK
jgi:hypothetical protein